MESYVRVKVVGKGTYGFAVLVQDKENKKYYLMKVITLTDFAFSKNWLIQKLGYRCH